MERKNENQPRTGNKALEDLPVDEGNVGHLSTAPTTLDLTVVPRGNNPSISQLDGTDRQLCLRWHVVGTH